MARFESDGIDDLIEDLSIPKIDCPHCNRSFEVELDDTSLVVTCPYCKAKVEL